MTPKTALELAALLQEGYKRSVEWRVLKAEAAARLTQDPRPPGASVALADSVRLGDMIDDKVKQDLAHRTEALAAAAEAWRCKVITELQDDPVGAALFNLGWLTEAPGNLLADHLQRLRNLERMLVVYWRASEERDGYPR